MDEGHVASANARTVEHSDGDFYEATALPWNANINAKTR